MYLTKIYPLILKVSKSHRPVLQVVSRKSTELISHGHSRVQGKEYLKKVIWSFSEFSFPWFLLGREREQNGDITHHDRGQSQDTGRDRFVD